MPLRKIRFVVPVSQGIFPHENEIGWGKREPSLLFGSECGSIKTDVRDLPSEPSPDPVPLTSETSLHLGT